MIIGKNAVQPLKTLSSCGEAHPERVRGTMNRCYQNPEGVANRARGGAEG
tara:strand:- start:12 stop:161 length:150 start_codon:yes stop_codon:yes gene_type:complete